MKTYSVNEISRELNVEEETVRRWIRSKSLPSKLDSRKKGHIVSADDLEKFAKKKPKYAAGIESLIAGASAVGGATAIGTAGTAAAAGGMILSAPLLAPVLVGAVVAGGIGSSLYKKHQKNGDIPLNDIIEGIYTEICDCQELMGILNLKINALEQIKFDRDYKETNRINDTYMERIYEIETMQREYIFRAMNSKDFTGGVVRVINFEETKDLEKHLDIHKKLVNILIQRIDVLKEIVELLSKEKYDSKHLSKLGERLKQIKQEEMKIWELAYNL